MISYADVPLSEPDAGQLAAIERHLADVPEFEQEQYPGYRRRAWTLPGALPQPSPQINTLWWPRGASRYAIGHFLATTTQLDRIRQEVAGGGSPSYRSRTLKMWDGSTRSPIEAVMWMLPPRPLHQCGGAKGLYLLTLVDGRYFYQKKAGTVSISEGSTTWVQVFTAIESALGVTVSREAVHADYLYPAESLLAQYDDLAHLLDATAYNVGLRVIAELDGTLSAQSAGTARTYARANLRLARKHTGGNFSLDRQMNDGKDLPALVPQSVTTVFSTVRDRERTCSPYAVSTTLASLEIAEFASVAGHPGTKIFHDFAFPNYSSGSPTNSGELTTLGARIARDWYSWQPGWLDHEFAGLALLQPEGLHDVIEWRHRPDGLITRVMRPAYDDRTEQLHHAGTYYSSWAVTESRKIRVSGTTQDGSGYQGGYLVAWSGTAWVDQQPIQVRETNAVLLGAGTKAWFEATLEGCRNNSPLYVVSLEEFPGILSGGSGGVYTFDEAEFVAGEFQIKSGGRTGTARERNLFANIPTDSVVWLYQAPLNGTTYFFDYEVGDGDGGGSTIIIINVENILNLYYYVENQLYFNIYDNRLYIYVNGIWVVFCPCDYISGSGGNAPTGVVVPCCDDPLPRTLYLTITNKTGTCSCLPDTITLTWDDDYQQWKYPGTYADCTDPDFTLVCSRFPSVHWELASTYLATGATTPNSVNCDPFEAVFTMNAASASTCTGSFTATVTE